MTQAAITAFVAGGGKGRGEELARALSSGGARVAVRVLEECAAREISLAVIEAEESLGAIDALVYDASSPQAGESRMLLDVDEQEWDRVMNRDLKGFFLACKFALPYLMGRENPCIVLLTEGGAALRGCGPHRAAAVAGVGAFASRMAEELAIYGVRVRVAEASSGGASLQDIIQGVG